MTVELGHYALVLAFLVALIQAGSGLWGGHSRNPHALALSGPAAITQAALATLAFGALTWAHVTSDFSVENVYRNSNSALPLIYRIAGVWGNHEGSMLLWIWTLSLLGALVAVIDATLPPTLRARVLGVQALIAVGFIGFSIFTSNPFGRVFPTPADGMDLNPLLQDPGLAFHPPFLYLGFVGFSVAFSFGVAALLEGRVDPAWARWVRPWTLGAWTSLTLGIGMGSAWAYYVLGWGGFWSWDPVENGSLMPWLAGTALLHSAAVVEKRDTLKAWTILMAITAFSTSVLSTFVVRSGLLTSVHAFANDQKRGMLLLAICLVMTGGALALYAFRIGAVKGGGGFQVVSRESALVLNNVLLTALLFTVAIGTFWPILAQVLFSQPVSVGAPYYVRTAVPLGALLALFMTLGVLIPWKRGDVRSVGKRLRAAAALTLVAAGVTFWLSGESKLLAAVGMAMAVWMVLGALGDVALRTKLFAVSPAESFRRARGLPRSAWGGALAHAGLGVAVLGMLGTSLWKVEALTVMRLGDTLPLAGYSLHFDALFDRTGGNFQSEVGHFTVSKGGKVVGSLEPERRWFPVAKQLTTLAANRLTVGGDLYLVLGDPRGANNEARVVRAYRHPLVGFIWLGVLIMVTGGVVSLSDGRYRLGLPVRRRTVSAPRPPATPGLVPAE
ncbi:heme lyase CcmF/NrfE family subunit [soil metagenome]